MTPDQVLQRLLEGNERYTTRKVTHPHQSAVRIHETANGQHPIAIILGCSDSRVPPEVIFDQGLGDLFVIRVAGNIVDDAILGSIEYAVTVLGVPLMLVLGHEHCGAVAAAVRHLEVPGHISTLVDAILPAIISIKTGEQDAIEAAVRLNVHYVVKQIRSSEPVLSALTMTQKLKIVGAHYDLNNGAIELLK